ncbi:MAG: hypothetical protein AB7O96_08965 [Pseudobdellovibrionaceae bacterium]
MKKGWALAILFVFSAFVSACGKVEMGVEDIKPSTETADDFLKSEILATGPGIADGVSELVVVVRLMNENLSVIKGFRPNYDIVSGDGVIKTNCTESDQNGVAVCVLKSTIPGKKMFKVVNIEKVVLSKEFQFDPKPAGEAFGFVAGGKTITSSSGWKVQAAVGQELSNIKASSNADGSGWKMFGTIQGNIISE